MGWRWTASSSRSSAPSSAERMSSRRTAEACMVALVGGDAALAEVLGPVHGEVGVAERRLDRPGLVDVGDADAGGGGDGSLAELVRASIARWTRAATATASTGSPRSSTRSANSSPPSRPAMSPGRRHASDPLGDRSDQRVPGGVPQAVVDRLEVVEVDQDDRVVSGRSPGDPGGASASSRSATRAANRSRLASPVSGSWVAWRSRSASSSFSRVTSTSTPRKTGSPCPRRAGSGTRRGSTARGRRGGASGSGGRAGRRSARGDPVELLLDPRAVLARHELVPQLRSCEPLIGGDPSSFSSRGLT